MKKGLIVMMIVLMTMALITSCNPEAASTTDSLVEVKIAGGADSKSLNVGSSSNLPDISTLKWYYQAEKKSGVFINGQTDGWAEVPGVETGLEGASLGQFSKGDWEFQFKGVDTSTEDVIFESAVIEKEVSSSTAVNGTVYLTVPLTANASGAKVTFSDLSWNKPDEDRLADVTASNFTLTITDSDPSNTSTWTGAGYSGGVVTFTHVGDSDSFSYTTAGAHAYTFTVKYGEELVAQYVHNVNVALGSDYTIDGSVDVSSNIQYSVVVNDVPVSVIENSATVVGNTSEMTFTVSKTPASVTTGTASETTVVFTNYAADTTKSYYIAQETYGAEEAAKFVVTTANSANAVAGIDLDLYEFVSDGEDVKQTVSDQTVQVTTTIATGLTDVAVNGATLSTSANGVTLESYDPATGVLVFTTTHFSQFLVTSSNGAINATKNIAYDTVISAVSAASTGDTIMLLKDNELSSGEVVINHGITLDGNGYKYKNTRNPKDNLELTKYSDSFKSGRDAAVYVNTSDPVVFKNLKIETTKIGFIFVGPKTDSSATGDDDATNADNGKIDIIGCEFVAPGNRYGLFVNNGVDNLKLNIVNSTLKAYGAIYSKSQNSIYTINNSVIYGFNTASAHSSNSFGAIVFESRHQNSDNTIADNNSIVINNSEIIVESTSPNTNLEIWLCLQYGANSNTVTVTNTQIINEPNGHVLNNHEWEAVVSNDTSRNSNTVTVDGVSIGWIDNNHV